MSKAAERALRRYIREKATIDRIVRGARKRPPSGGGAKESPTTSTGLSVEEQIRKKWGPDKGGLPNFWPDPPAFLRAPLPRRGRGRS